MKNDITNSKVLIRFTNNRGEVVWLPADSTIEDLVRAGIKMQMVRNGTPLPDNWYASQEKKP